MVAKMKVKDVFFILVLAAGLCIMVYEFAQPYYHARSNFEKECERYGLSKSDIFDCVYYDLTPAEVCEVKRVFYGVYESPNWYTKYDKIHGKERL